MALLKRLGPFYRRGKSLISGKVVEANTLIWGVSKIHLRLRLETLESLLMEGEEESKIHLRLR